MRRRVAALNRRVFGFVSGASADFAAAIHFGGRPRRFRPDPAARRSTTRIASSNR